MSSRPFVHLHCHSHYSLLDGASKVPALVKRAMALNMPALAITDHGNLYGAVEFLRESKAAGLKPIVGLEAYVAPRHRTERSMGGGSGKEYAFHLTLLARNGEGYATSCDSRRPHSSKGFTTSLVSIKRFSSVIPKA